MATLERSSDMVHVLRRNGKLGSCEPCRKSKLKCDHAMPTCLKCKKRNLESKCFYHPAPLTQKISKKDRAERTAGAPRQIRPRGVCPVQHSTTPYTPLSTPQNESTHQFPATPASSVSFTRGDSVLFKEAGSSLDIMFCVVGPYLLERLESLPIFERILDQYFNANPGSFMSGPLFMPAVRALRADLAHLRSIKSLADIAADITKNTRRPFVVPMDTAGVDFYKLFTGDNLRWDFIGTIFGWTGLCTYLIPLKEITVILSTMAAPLSSDFAVFPKEMVAASNHCISLCQECDAISDLSLWLMYSNALLLCNSHGDAHPLVWRRGGEISTEIFALGIHKSPKTAQEVPFFLDQARKRVFAVAYKSDKLSATFLNRPPRIPRQFCDFQMPLDLSDEEVLLQGDALQAAMSKLNSDGWNIERRFNAVTWQRARYQISIFREELLELSFLNNETNHSSRLLSIAQDLESMWASFPSHVKYTEDVWDNYSGRTCLMSIQTYLDYLHSVFTTERLLSTTHPSVRPKLLRTCTLLLATVIVLTKQRTLIEDVEISRDLPWFLLYFGLPAAGVLTKEIRTCAVSGEALPSFLSKAELIKNTSVLVTYLDWFGGMENRYYELSAAASKKLSVELDEVINRTEMCAASAATATTASTNNKTNPIPAASSTSPPAPSTIQADLGLHENPTSEQHAADHPASHPSSHPETEVDMDAFTGAGIDSLMHMGDHDMGTDSSFLNWVDSFDWNASIPTF